MREVFTDSTFSRVMLSCAISRFGLGDIDLSGIGSSLQPRFMDLNQGSRQITSDAPFRIMCLDFRQIGNIYSAHTRTRKSAGSMTRKLSVTWSQ